MFSQRVDEWIVFVIAASVLFALAVGMVFAGRQMRDASRRRDARLKAKRALQEEVQGCREVIQNIRQRRSPENLDVLQVQIGTQLDGRTAYDYFDTVGDIADEFEEHAKAHATLEQKFCAVKWRKLSVETCNELAAEFAKLCDEMEQADDDLDALESAAHDKRLPSIETVEYVKQEMTQEIGGANEVFEFLCGMLSESQPADPLTMAHLYKNEVHEAIVRITKAFNQDEYQAVRHLLETEVIPLIRQFSDSVFEFKAGCRALEAELQTIRDEFDEAEWIMSLPSDLNYARAERRLAALRKQFEEWAQYAHLLSVQDYVQQLDDYRRDIASTYVGAFDPHPLLSEPPRHRRAAKSRVSTQIADFASV